MKNGFVLSLCVSVVLWGLAGCGFQPVYGTGNAGQPNASQAAFQQIALANIPDRTGQQLRNALIDRLYRDGRPDQPRYTLFITPLAEQIRDLDITKTSDSTRGQLRLSSALRLTDNQTGQVLLQRPLLAITSYNILGSEFTNRVAEESARKNAVTELTRQIELQLSLYFQQAQP
ncbi:MAG: LPS assembly lipoprotein LptE [Pseudomonadota bacterium]